MRRIRAFGGFLHDLVIGDDWRVAAGVVLAGGATAVLAAEGVPAWWFPPLAVLCLLCLSLRRATRG